jgi:predicted dehydrogenase
METDWNWRLQPDQGGALRAVGDIGSHWLDLTSSISGLHVTEVMADLATFVQTRQQPRGPVETYSRERATETVATQIATEDVATILLRYENGARGVVGISQVSPGRKNSLEYAIDGSTGSARWDSEHPDTLLLGHRDRPSEIMPRDAALMTSAGQDAAALPAGHVEGFADTFAALFRAVYADVLDGKMRDHPPYATFSDGHEEMLVGDAIAASSREGRWIEVQR